MIRLSFDGAAHAPMTLATGRIGFPEDGLAGVGPAAYGMDLSMSRSCADGSPVIRMPWSP